MLQAYVDDSVKHVDQNGKRERHVLFLAGYVQSAEKWAAFSHDWAEELARHPKIEYLHMVEAAGLRGEFHGVTEDERNRRLTRFAEIVSRSKPWSFDVAIDIKEYHEIMVDSVMYPWQSPYLVAYIGVVMLVSGLLERANHSSSVDFYFDDIEVMKRASDFVYLKLKEGFIFSHTVNIQTIPCV